MIRNENVCDQFKYLHEEQVYSGRENKLYWCGRCQIPVYYEKCPVCKQDAVPFVTDLRPVFPEEAVLLEILLKCKGELRGQSLWNAKGNRYFVNGKPLPFVLKDVVTEWDPFEVHRLWRDEILKGEDIGEDEFAERQQKFTVANRERLLKLEEDAFNCVKRAVAKFPQRIKMVSFSGGKDSTVVSSVVRRALGTNDILHVFCDTTIEFPFTYEYITVFRRRNRRVPFLKAQYRGYNEHTDKPFLELCRKIGPPSRVMRWCCTTFKTAPISDLIDKFSQEKGVLTFYGVRNSESVRRSKYRDIEHSPKIAKQVVASPIIDWNDLDIWLYLLTRQEEFNYAYRLGFPRVGCWCCPSNSDWAYFLAQVYLPEQAAEWNSFLVEFARRIGKPDAEEYVRSGNWKARQGGEGMDVRFSQLQFEPCANEPNARNYYLTVPITGALYEYFKPFGRLNFDIGKRLLGEVYVLDRITQEPVLILQGREGSRHLKVIAPNPFNLKLLFSRVECQLRKYQSCILCGGCPSICPAKAIKFVGHQYKIDGDKCAGCMKCIAYYDHGCLVAKVTQVRRSG